jgi:hypothetical protein
MVGVQLMSRKSETANFIFTGPRPWL